MHCSSAATGYNNDDIAGPCSVLTSFYAVFLIECVFNRTVFLIERKIECYLPVKIDQTQTLVI